MAVLRLDRSRTANNIECMTPVRGQFGFAGRRPAVCRSQAQLWSWGITAPTRDFFRERTYRRSALARCRASRMRNSDRYRTPAAVLRRRPFCLAVQPHAVIDSSKAESLCGHLRDQIGIGRSAKLNPFVRQLMPHTPRSSCHSAPDLPAPPPSSHILQPQSADLVPAPSNSAHSYSPKDLPA